VKIRVNNLLPLLVVLFLAGLTLWLREAAEMPSAKVRSNGSREPDAIVENFTLRSLTAEGTPQYVISARRMLHFAADDSTELADPRLSRTDADARVTIKADRGTLQHDGDEAAFYGHVVVRQEAPSQPDLVAQTDYVQVLNKQDLIRTDRPITIQQGESSLAGVGMDIHRRARQFSLHSQVKGSYHAAPRK